MKPFVFGRPTSMMSPVSSMGMTVTLIHCKFDDDIVSKCISIKWVRCISRTWVEFEVSNPDTKFPHHQILGFHSPRTSAELGGMVGQVEGVILPILVASAIDSQPL